MDAEVGAVHAGHGALESERNRLRDPAATLETRVAKQSAAMEAERTRLTAELAARERAIAEARERGAGDARRVAELLQAAEARQAEHTTQMAQLRGEHTTQMAQLRGEQAAQMTQLDADLAGQIAQLKSEAETRDSELAVLMAHLQEARRPIQPIEADVKRLTEELSVKSAAHAAVDEENRNLRATLEPTRATLEHRELPTRRLDSSETNNATQ